jgi:type VI protein secretion system component Hcp
MMRRASGSAESTWPRMVSTAAVLLMIAALARAASPPSNQAGNSSAPFTQQPNQVVGAFTFDGIAGGDDGTVTSLELRGFTFVGVGQLAPVLPSAVITKAVDAASPSFLERSFVGLHIANGHVDLFRSGSATVEASYDFQDILITSDTERNGAISGAPPLEDVSISFSRVRVTYFSATGSTFRTCFDVKENVRC